MITVSVYEGQFTAECPIDRPEEKIWVAIVDPKKPLFDNSRILKRIPAKLITTEDNVAKYKGDDGEEYYVIVGG